MYINKSYLNRIMNSLAKYVGLEWNGENFRMDLNAYSWSLLSRIENLERKLDRYSDPTPYATQEDLDLLLTHLGLKIEDGKRIVPIRKKKAVKE